jgi:FkbM family methyltransferase
VAELVSRALAYAGGVGIARRNGSATRKTTMLSLQAVARALRQVRARHPMLDPNTVTHEEAWRFFERRRGSYDELLKSLEGLVLPGKGIVDVGANVGYFSWRLREQMECPAPFFLFEPHPHLAGLCRTTFQGCPDVTVFKTALGNEERQSMLFVADDGNIGWNTMVSERREAGMQPVPVGLRRFDSFGFRNIGLVKIDVEGFEWAVIAGMEAFVRAGERPVLLIEIAWGRDHPHWARMLESCAFLESVGYEFHSTDLRPLDIRRLSRTRDVLALPMAAGSAPCLHADRG